MSNEIQKILFSKEAMWYWLIIIIASFSFCLYMFFNPKPIDSFGSINYDDTRQEKLGASNDIVSKRTYNQKSYGNKTKISVGFLHYKDEQGNFQDVDYSWEDMGDYWRMVYSNYKLFVAKNFLREQLIRFDNVYEGANYSIYYEPKMLAWINKTDLSDMKVFRNQQNVIGKITSDNKIRFSNAFGDGIHFEITLSNEGFKKEIVIDEKNKLEQPPTSNHKLVALFKYTGGGLKIYKSDTEWDYNNYFEGEEDFKLIDNSGKITFIKQAYIREDVGVDSKIVPIKVFWKKYNGNLYQAKILPKSFLLNASYPVRADTDTKINTGSNAGDTFKTSSSWATARTGNAGGVAVNPTSHYMQSELNGANYTVKRHFYEFNISGIDDGENIDSAVIGVYSLAPSYDGNSDSLVFITTPTLGGNNIAVGNHDDNVGGAAASETIAFGDVTAAGLTEWELNSTGLANIDLSNTYAAFQMVFESDRANTTPTDREYFRFYYNTVNNYPYIEITHSSGGESDPCQPTPGEPFFQSQDCYITSDVYHNERWITNGHKLIPDGGSLIIDY